MIYHAMDYQLIVVQGWMAVLLIHTTSGLILDEAERVELTEAVVRKIHRSEACPGPAATPGLLVEHAAGGSAQTATCKAGRFLLGNRERVCVKGTWSHPLPGCADDTCKTFRKRLGSKVLNETVTHAGSNVAVKLSCEDDFELNGPEFIFCHKKAWRLNNTIKATNANLPSCRRQTSVDERKAKARKMRQQFAQLYYEHVVNSSCPQRSLGIAYLGGVLRVFNYTCNEISMEEYALCIDGTWSSEFSTCQDITPKGTPISTIGSSSMATSTLSSTKVSNTKSFRTTNIATTTQSRTLSTTGSPTTTRMAAPSKFETTKRTESPTTQTESPSSTTPMSPPPTTSEPQPYDPYKHIQDHITTDTVNEEGTSHSRSTSQLLTTLRPFVGRTRYRQRNRRTTTERMYYYPDTESSTTGFRKHPATRKKGGRRRRTTIEPSGFRKDMTTDMTAATNTLIMTTKRTTPFNTFNEVLAERVEIGGGKWSIRSGVGLILLVVGTIALLLTSALVIAYYMSTRRSSRPDAPLDWKHSGITNGGKHAHDAHDQSTRV